MGRDLLPGADGNKLNPKYRSWFIGIAIVTSIIATLICASGAVLFYIYPGAVINYSPWPRPVINAYIHSRDFNLLVYFQARLKKFGQSAVPALSSHLDSSDDNMRGVALANLGFCGNGAAKYLQQALLHSDESVRIQAIYSLGRMNSDLSIEILGGHYLIEPRASARLAIVEVLYLMMENNSALPALLQAIEDPDPRIVQDLIDKLSHVPSAKLILATCSNDLVLRRRSAKAISNLIDDKFKERLLQMCEDADDEVRKIVVGGLDKYREPAVYRELILRLADKSDEVKAISEKILTAAGREAEMELSTAVLSENPNISKKVKEIFYNIKR